MSELWTSIVNLLQSGGTFIAEVARLLFAWSLALFAVAWVAFALDWRKLWPALREGAAVPFLLIAVMIAFAWGFLVPSHGELLGIPLPNYLWQVVLTTLLLGVMFFCGWLQMRYGWFPPEIELEPAGGHGHDAPGHGDHGHGHHAAHASIPEDEADDDGIPAEPPPVPVATHGH